MERTILLISFLFFIQGISSQISNDIDFDVKDTLSEHMPDLNLGSIDESKIPQADELDLIFRNKCDGKSGNGTYDKIKEAKDVYLECVSNFVNFTVLKEEVEESKKTGSMDEVFGKYCDKYPELSNCSMDFLENIQPCLEDNERKSLNISMGLTHKLKDFVCHKNGDRIAMFVAEGGVECVSSQKTALQQCLNYTLSSRMPSEANLNPMTLPVIMFDAQDCKDFAKFRNCISEALGKCQETTPANLVDAFFKYAKKILPCTIEAMEAEKSVKGNVFTVLPSSFILIVSLVLVKLVS